MLLCFPLTTASLFSINSPKTLIQGLSCGDDTRRVASGRVINPVNSGTAITHPLAKYLSREVLSLSRSWHCSIDAPTRQCNEPFLCCVGEISGSNLLVIGVHEPEASVV